MARKKKTRIDVGTGPGGGDSSAGRGSLTHSPFASWAERAGVKGAGAGNAGGSELAGSADEPSEIAATSGRIRHERKGHGGKTVTVLELDRSIGAEALHSMARDIGRALGTRAREVDGDIVVQGDVRERLERHLDDVHGIKTIRGTH